MVQNSTALGEALKNARIVRNDERNGIWIAWYGGPAFYGYNSNGEQIAYWESGATDEHNQLAPEKALASIENHIENQYYPY